MSLESITKKDIENLFNKILRSQINRQNNEVISINTSHSSRFKQSIQHLSHSRTSGNLSEEQIIQEKDSRFHGNDVTKDSRFHGNDELVGLKTKDLVCKNEENENLECKEINNTKRRKQCRI